MLKKPDPILVTTLFPEILEELILLLKSLSVSDWTEPTACSGWSVKDVALHLLGIEIGNLSNRRDGFSDNNHIENWEQLVIIVNNWNQKWVQATRRMSTRLLIDLIGLVGPQMCDYFSKLDPFEIGGAISWIGPEPLPVWLDLAREYTERWHHQQHIRDAVNKPGLKQPKFFSPVLNTFMWALPKTYHGVIADEGTSITVKIEGQSGGHWSLIKEGEKWLFFKGAVAHPDSEIILDQEIAWRLFTRGLKKEQMGNVVRIIGNQHLGKSIHHMVSIIG